MISKRLSKNVSVSGQLNSADLETLQQLGVDTIVCNRADHEEEGQATFSTLLAAATLLRVHALHLPLTETEMALNDVEQVANLIKAGKRLHLFCKTGERSAWLWALACLKLGYQESVVIDKLTGAGYAIGLDRLHSLLQETLIAKGTQPNLTEFNRQRMQYYDIVIVGGGSAGVSVCAKLNQLNKDLKIAIAEPNHKLFYQPAWTMVAGGVLRGRATHQRVKKFIPAKVDWLQHSVVHFQPERHLVELDSGTYVHYQQLIIATGLEMNWDGIEGLRATLGRNGVTSNYRYDLAPYTWRLINSINRGKALFTQPSMPIKSAGAPQQAMFLAADHWYKRGLINTVDIEFYTAEESLFRIPDYLPTLNKYLNKYQIEPKFRQTLKKIDGGHQVATFAQIDSEGHESTVETNFNMLHVSPPQRAVAPIRESQLCDDSSLLDVHPETLNHRTYSSIWGLGDIINTPNAKSLSAVRKQVPVVAANVLSALRGEQPVSRYSGYSACPFIVEQGRVIFAEFDYRGQHSPSIPKWLNDGTKATRLAWYINQYYLPRTYWHRTLNGTERW